jgi:hypothetical protein
LVCKTLLSWTVEHYELSSTLFYFLGASHKGEFSPRKVFNEATIALNGSIIFSVFSKCWCNM